jgi:hypothetical protein
MPNSVARKLSSSWASLVAPMMVEVTPGWCGYPVEGDLGRRFAELASDVNEHVHDPPVAFVSEKSRQHWVILGLLEASFAAAGVAIALVLACLPEKPRSL